VPASAVAGANATVSPIAAAKDDRSACATRCVVAQAPLAAHARRSSSVRSKLRVTARVILATPSSAEATRSGRLGANVAKTGWSSQPDWNGNRFHLEPFESWETNRFSAGRGDSFAHPTSAGTSRSRSNRLDVQESEPLAVPVCLRIVRGEGRYAR